MLKIAALNQWSHIWPIRLGNRRRVRVMCSRMKYLEITKNPKIEELLKTGDKDTQYGKGAKKRARANFLQLKLLPSAYEYKVKMIQSSNQRARSSRNDRSSKNSFRFISVVSLKIYQCPGHAIKNFCPKQFLNTFYVNRVYCTPNNEVFHKIQRTGSFRGRSASHRT